MGYAHGVAKSQTGQSHYTHTHRPLLLLAGSLVAESRSYSLVTVGRLLTAVAAFVVQYRLSMHGLQ